MNRFEACGSAALRPANLTVDDQGLVNIAIVKPASLGSHMCSLSAVAGSILERLADGAVKTVSLSPPQRR